MFPPLLLLKIQFFNYNFKIYETGKETVKEAAKVTQVNRKYGFVSSENKKDQRSIEQTLADLRAKKKQKKDEEWVVTCDFLFDFVLLLMVQLH